MDMNEDNNRQLRCMRYKRLNNTTRRRSKAEPDYHTLVTMDIGVAIGRQTARGGRGLSPKEMRLRQRLKVRHIIPLSNLEQGVLFSTKVKTWYEDAVLDHRVAASTGRCTQFVIYCTGSEDVLREAFDTVVRLERQETEMTEREAQFKSFFPSAYAIHKAIPALTTRPYRSQGQTFKIGHAKELYRRLVEYIYDDNYQSCAEFPFTDVGILLKVGVLYDSTAFHLIRNIVLTHMAQLEIRVPARLQLTL